jgi:hypothetical protein
MSNIPQSKPVIPVGAVRNFAVSFVDVLDAGELLTGTPTVVDEATTGVLTIGNKAVNTAALTINNHPAAIGQAVQFSVSGQVASASEYAIKITVQTTSTPPQTLVGVVKFRAEAI